MDQIIHYDRNEFHETQSGNKISKRQYIKGQEYISVSGRCIFHKDIIIRGDLAKVNIGKYVIILESVIIKPSYIYTITKDSPQKKVIKFNSVQIGDYVNIGERSIIQAIKIGSCTTIGKNCTLCQRCIIGENSIILDDSIVPPDTQIPPNSVYGGRPAIFQGETPEMAGVIQKNKNLSYYKNFQPK